MTVNIYDNSMSVYICERNAYGYVYELSMVDGDNAVKATVTSIVQITKLARMLGTKTIVIESNSTLRYDVNGTDLASMIETEIVLQGAVKRGRKYNPSIIVTAVLS